MHGCKELISISLGLETILLVVRLAELDAHSGLFDKLDQRV